MELTKEVLLQRITDSKFEIAFHNGVIKNAEACIAYLEKKDEPKPEPAEQAEAEK
jgi:hypothetical protein